MNKLGIEELKRLKLEAQRESIIEARDDGYVIWEVGNILQLNYKSVGCSLGKQGYCMVCEYGRANSNITQQQCLTGLIEASEAFENNRNLKELVIGTYGSIFDTKEFSREYLEYIANRLRNQDFVNRITFETHYTTVTEDVLQLLKAKLPNKTIGVELGLESANKDTLLNSYGKYIDFKQFEKVVNLIKQYGFVCNTNIMFGAPFLTDDEQEKDTIDSIEWAFNHNIDLVVIFPVNIKPHTYLHKLYENGDYVEVSSYRLVKLLDKLPTRYLENIVMSWTGDRQSKDIIKTNKAINLSKPIIKAWSKIIPPYTCDKCRGILEKFFLDYRLAYTAQERKELIHRALKDKQCRC